MKATEIYIVLNSLDQIIIKRLENDSPSMALPIARGIMFCKGIKDTSEYWDSDLGHIIESKDKKDYCIIR